MKDLGKNSVFPNRETNIFLWRPKKKKKERDLDSLDSLCLSSLKSYQYSKVLE